MFIKEINIKRRQLSHDDKIGDKVVDSLSSNWVTSDNKTIHTLPLPSIQIWGGSKDSGTKLHEVGGRGEASFYPFEVGKMSERPYRANCFD